MPLVTVSKQVNLTFLLPKEITSSQAHDMAPKLAEKVGGRASVFLPEDPEKPLAIMLQDADDIAPDDAARQLETLILDQRLIETY